MQSEVILNRLRQWIVTSDESRYAIAKATGLSQAMLSMFVAGDRGLSLESVVVLAKYFGHELVLKRRKGI